MKTRDKGSYFKAKFSSTNVFEYKRNFWIAQARITRVVTAPVSNLPIFYSFFPVPFYAFSDYFAKTYTNEAGKLSSFIVWFFQFSLRDMLGLFYFSHLSSQNKRMQQVFFSIFW